MFDWSKLIARAQNVLFNPVGNIAATDVQGAIAELEGEKANISQTITDGVTTSAPSENAVYDALTGKAPLANPTFTGLVTTAGQIKFPATQNPSSDPNTLDDYEEGTWTPTLTPSGGGSISLDTLYDLCAYTKIGRLVHVQGQVMIASVSSPVGGYVDMTLPFTVSGSSKLTWRFGGAIFYNSGTGRDLLPFSCDQQNNNIVHVFIDSSTLAATQSFVFSFSYKD